MNDQLRDATISGSGELSGGRYRDVRISGSGRIYGDVEAQALHVSGSAQFQGDVSAGSISISGSARFNGNLDADACKLSGSASIDGHLHARKLSTSGSMSCRAGVRGEEIRVSGNLRTGGDVEAESFTAAGGFKIDGLLNASRIRITLHGRCSAREIGGDQVEVELSRMNIFSMLMTYILDLFGRGAECGLQAELIEATHVRLDWSNVRTVRGNQVHIGPGSRIELLEYTESAYIDPKAVVKEARQIG